MLIKEHFYANDPAPTPLKAACLDVFNARAEEAIALGLTPRYLPPTFIASARWAETYSSYADPVGMTYTLNEATTIVQAWVDAITQW
jgi:hypothetical protein